MNYRATLFDMVNNLVQERWDVPTFEREFYHFYLETVPTSALTDREHEFFGLLQERLDWTSADVDSLERSYGWQNLQEYQAWVKDLLRRFEVGEPLAHP